MQVLQYMRSTLLAMSLTGIPSVTFGGVLEFWANTTGEQIVDFGDYGEIDYGTRSQFFASRGAELTIALGNFAVSVARS